MFVYSKYVYFLAAALLGLALLTGCTSTPTGLPPAQIPQAAAAPTIQPAQPTNTLAPVADEVKPELEKYFQGYKGAFVLYDLKKQHTLRYNPQQCAEAVLPASTFKILNSLIGLESGVIPDENYVIKWNGAQYENPVWNQDHTFKSALQNSVVWYYQELARRVGQEKMQAYVSAADYGNRDISGKIDSFWLEGGLRISPDQQIDFLTRFYQEKLPFSQRSFQLVKELLTQEKTDSYRLVGKTGTVQRTVPYVGWFVGYVERDGKVYIFATNIQGASSDISGVKAREISRNILKSMGLVP
jgi:beta-lactamase class D